MLYVAHCTPNRIRVLWICNGDLAASDRQVLEHLTGFSVEVAYGVHQALNYLATSSCDVIFASLPLDGPTFEGFLEQAQRLCPQVPCLASDPSASLASAARLVRLGVYHLFGRMPEGNELAACLEAAAEERRSRDLARFADAVAAEPWRRFLVGESRAIQNIAEVVRLAGPRRSTVLITGETGTGKEMAAKALHMASPRAHLPMVALSCAALPENLLEAELFGHVKGAFTGALGLRKGRFEQAHNSTLFLDEIGDMPLDLQAKLLRVLQEREFQRLGSSETVRVDVRVIAATNADLPEKVREGRFREDLYYRLNVVPIRMPSLRERVSDIPLLVRHFLEKVSKAEGLPVKSVPRETLERLCSYDWPGNVRQLENAVETAVVMSGERTVLLPGDFPLPARVTTAAPPPAAAAIAVPDEGLDFERTVSSIERSLLEQALRKTGGNKKQAADILRLKRTTLSAKLRSLEAVAGI